MIRPAILNRRRFLQAVSGGLLAAPAIGEAQLTTGLHRIGYLGGQSASGGGMRFQAFRQGLRDHGYVEGRNINIDVRWADGNYERLPALARELVGLRSELIMSAGGPPVARALKSATTSTPVVFVSGSAVGAGLVSSLARPGGNLTGVEILAEELDAKRLELLKETLPSATRMAVLWNPDNLKGKLQRQQLEVAARIQGVRLHFIETRVPDDIERAFGALARERADAVLVSADPMLDSEDRRIVELIARARRPAIHGFRSAADAGALMSYGADLLAAYRNVAGYVDKILKGAKPSDLPVEQATKFELVINLKTARALGLKIPPSLLARADHVIE